MAIDLSKLRNAVSRNTTVDGSARELLNRIPQLIRDAIAKDDIGDATNINALADELEASNDGLAADVVANTPAAEEPPAGGGEPGPAEPPA